MNISARNQLPGIVETTTLGDVTVEVDAGAIARTSAESLDLAPGDTVTMIVKSTEVMIGK